MQSNAMKCNARENQKTKPPFKNRRGDHGLQVKTPTKEHNQNNKLTVYLVDVASADHGDKALPSGAETKFRTESQTEFLGKVSRTKFCTIVVSSSEEQPKAAKEVGKGWG
jgi:hypothetical protein